LLDPAVLRWRGREDWAAALRALAAPLVDSSHFAAADQEGTQPAGLRRPISPRMVLGRGEELPDDLHIIGSTRAMRVA